MNDKEKAKAYDEVIKQATKELQTCGSLDCDAARQIFRLFPQLKESEDERIRKRLLWFLANYTGKWDYPETRMACRAWLEKQKELDKMIVVSPEVWDNAISDAYENGKKDNEKQKENPEEPKIAFGDWGDKEKQEAIFTCLKYMRFIKKITNQEYNDLTEWLGSNLVYNLLGNGWYLKQKEQKQAEWSDTKELVFKDICNHLKEEGYSGWVLLLNALRNGEFQPKLAWSKEDEKIIDTIVSVLGQYIDYKAVSGTGSGYATPRYSKEIDWLNSLSLNLKKKNEDVAKLCSNEWSKEDEDTINLIIAILRENHPNGQFKTNPANTTCMSTISTDMLIKRIESLRPSWKPSEEQIYSLGTVVKGSGDCAVGSVGYNLKELYEQLKTLM